MITYYINKCHNLPAESCLLVGLITKVVHVSGYKSDVLHWLPISQEIACRVSALPFLCNLGSATVYIRGPCRELYRPTLRVRDCCSFLVSVQGDFLPPKRLPPQGNIVRFCCRYVDLDWLQLALQLALQ